MSPRLPVLLCLCLLACGDKDESTDSAAGVEDRDGDGFAGEQDCNDADPGINPDADEVCNGVDDDCDGSVDVDPVSGPMFYGDADADGYGDSAVSVQACAAPSGFVDNDEDCDDSALEYNPGALEDDCTDPADYNCDGESVWADADGDSWAACVDCDDSDAGTFPGAPDSWYDGVDQDCAGDSDYDADGDGHDAEPEGLDCDDTNPDIRPGATDISGDGIDQNCDGYDDGADSDGDGLADVAEVNTWGTDPDNPDTDGDGLSDGDEVNLHGSDPTLADTDGDGYSDGDEVASFTDPADATDHEYTGGWGIDACRGSITSTGTQVGQVAPNFALIDQFGDTVRLYDFCDRAVLMEFGSFW